MTLIEGYFTKRKQLKLGWYKRIIEENLQKTPKNLTALYNKNPLNSKSRGFLL